MTRLKFASVTWDGAPSLDTGNDTQGTIFQNRLSGVGGQVKAEGGGDMHGCTLAYTHEKNCKMVERRLTGGLDHCRA